MLREQDITTLRTFITGQLAAGASEQQLRTALMSEGGWLPQDLDTVFALVSNAGPVPPVQPASETQVAGSIYDVGMVQSAGSPTNTDRSVQEPAQVTSVPFPAQPTVLGGVNAFGVQPQEVSTASGSHGKRLGLVVGAVIGTILLGGGAFAAYQFLGPFALSSNMPYTEEDFIAGMFEKVRAIDTGTATVSGSATMEARDVDAEPFVLNDGGEMVKYHEAYARDVERFEHLNILMDALLPDRLAYYGAEDLDDQNEMSFPANLDDIAQLGVRSYYYNTGKDTQADPTRDPLTDNSYEYRLTDEGTNFELIMTFETDDALGRFRSNSNFGREQRVSIDGMSVTFTKDSDRWYYMNSEPSKPFLVELGEQARMLPPELDVSFSLKGTADMHDVQNADWEVALEGAADLGDMSYKVALDVRKVDEKYHLRLRNIPGLFSMFVPLNKNEWVTIDPNTLKESDESGDFGMVSELSEGISEMEEEYDTYREMRTRALEKLVSLAQEEHLIRFREEPHKEVLNDEALFRYDITVRKEALLPFLTKAMEALKELDAEGDFIVDDAGLIAYLKSDAFDQTFEYLEQNMRAVVYVDSEGYPIKTELSTRLVPPDTAVKLRDKQLRAMWITELDNINEPITIEMPEGARPIEDVVKEFEMNMRYPDMSMIPSAITTAANALSSVWSSK